MQLRESPRVNAHTHIYSGLAPLGMPPPERAPKNFVEILERVWWRLDRALDAETLEAAARFYVAEALLAGTSTLIDHHESPSFVEGSLDVLADACQELGLRALLCYGATERNGGHEEARRGLAECARFLRDNRRPLVRGAVGLHASFTVSDETIREAGELCRELGAVMHVHLAEDVADVEDARQRGYEGPLERLLALEALPPGSILAHGVHLGPDQVERAAAAGCWLVQNPRSNRGNAVGYPRALSRSSRVALGTDGYPSNMDEEEQVLREEAAAHGETGQDADRRVAGGTELARGCLGIDADSNEDFVLTENGRIRRVAIAGRTVVDDERLTTGDIEGIRVEARIQASRLWSRMASL
jgi:cytosine/adenosine deaminase-related metal-dependent hydrolase